MRKALLAAAVLWISVCLPASADPIREDHPIVGTWKIWLPGLSCGETYRIHADGTSDVVSADEVGESSFTIADEPSPSGFYKMVDTIVKDNGGKDCAGAVMTIGDTSTRYLIFHPAGTSFLMCIKEDTTECIGPFVRVKEEST